jgi:RNA polymerase sigma-70 factor (ECF subfamily)
MRVNRDFLQAQSNRQHFGQREENMNSPTSRVAPALATQRSAAGFHINTPGGTMSEAEAVERAQQGDVAAFETLYGLHKHRIYSLCRRISGDEAEAEDLAQEAFLLVYRKIAT